MDSAAVSTARIAQEDPGIPPCQLPFYSSLLNHLDLQNDSGAFSRARINCPLSARDGHAAELPAFVKGRRPQKPALGAGLTLTISRLPTNCLPSSPWSRHEMTGIFLAEQIFRVGLQALFTFFCEIGAATREMAQSMEGLLSGTMFSVHTSGQTTLTLRQHNPSSIALIWMAT